MWAGCRAIWSLLIGLFRSRATLEAENLVPRQQIRQLRTNFAVRDAAGSLFRHGPRSPRWRTSAPSAYPHDRCRRVAASRARPALAAARSKCSPHPRTAAPRRSWSRTDFRSSYSSSWSMPGSPRQALNARWPAHPEGLIVEDCGSDRPRRHHSTFTAHVALRHHPRLDITRNLRSARSKHVQCSPSVHRPPSAPAP
jgi:hypothetical protein